jgi:hypothetical protein
MLRHPTKDLHHVDPATIVLWSPVFGHLDVHAWKRDLTIQHNGQPLGERMKVRWRVLDGEGHPVRGQLVEIWQANSASRYIHKRDSTLRRSILTSPVLDGASPPMAEARLEQERCVWASPETTASDRGIAHAQGAGGAIIGADPR